MRSKASRSRPWYFPEAAGAGLVWDCTGIRFDLAPIAGNGGKQGSWIARDRIVPDSEIGVICVLSGSAESVLLSLRSFFAVRRAGSVRPGASLYPPHHPRSS